MSELIRVLDGVIYRISSLVSTNPMAKPHDGRYWRTQANEIAEDSQ